MYSPNCGEKNFFLQNFSTNQISRKNQIQLFHFLSIWIERLVNNNAEKLLLTIIVLSKSGRKRICFLQNFSTNQISRKNQIQFCHVFSIGIQGRVSTDGEKIQLTIVVLWKSVTKEFFFFKIFRPIRFREKIQFNFPTFSQLESRDQWTLMVKKFYLPLLCSPNQREKFFLFKKIFRPIRFRVKMKFNSSIFFSLESRDQWTLMLKKFHWASFYS